MNRINDYADHGYNLNVYDYERISSLKQAMHYRIANHKYNCRYCKFIISKYFVVTFMVCALICILIITVSI